MIRTAEVPLRDLTQIRKALVKASRWGGGRCRGCDCFAFVAEGGQQHQGGCYVKGALDILDAYAAYIRHLAPRALKPKLVKSLKQAGGKR